MNDLLDNIFHPAKPVRVLGEEDGRDLTSAKRASLVSSACVFA